MMRLAQRSAWYIFVGTLCGVQTYSVAAQDPNIQSAPPNATAQLVIKDSVSSFRSGEPIQLEIVYRSNEPTCYVVTNTEPSLMDTVELTPEKGVYRWQQGDGAGSDASAWGKIEPGKPVSFGVTLNDLYRFDEPGDYTVRVRTRHLHCGVYPEAHASELATNARTFHVEPFAAADERQLAESLEQRIRNAGTQPEAERLAKRLDYLPGDDATRAKISLTLHPKLFYPFGISVTNGLWIARNRGMIIAAFEAAINDPSIFVDRGLIDTLVQLQRDGSRPQSTCCVLSASRREDPLSPGYLHELALSLPRRSGENLVGAALTVFEANAGEKSRTAQSDADFQSAREILISHLGEVNEYQVGGLLRQYGPQLEDRRVLPTLQKLVETSSGSFSSNRSAALQQIQRIAPDGLDAYIVQEACNEQPLHLKEVLSLTTAEILPAVDDCLTKHLQESLKQPASGQRAIKRDRTLEYIARFADANLVPQVMGAYKEQDAGEHWSQQARGAALCYLIRWNAPGAKQLLQSVLPGGAEADQVVLFSTVETALPSNVPLRSLLREQIFSKATPDGTVVYDLSQVGTDEDRQFLLNQLDRFHATHEVPYSDADEMVEVELVTAQIRGRTWNFSGEIAKQISLQECRTEKCRSYFHVLTEGPFQ